MRRILLAFALLLPALAAAQDAPPDLIGAISTSAPNVTIHGYQCSTDRYPSPASTKNYMMGTLIGVIVAVDGTVKTATVERSSGNGDVDSAAMACAKDWKFHPALKDGQPIEAPARAVAVWPAPSSQTNAITQVTTQRYEPRPQINSPAAIGRPHSCWPERYPIGALLAHAEGRTQVSFTITEEGKVKDPSLLVPSGNDELDRAALACVPAWTYVPATQNGAPVAVPWKASVNWKAQSDADTMPSGPAPVCKPHRGTASSAIVLFTIGEKGRAKDAQIGVSSGDAAFDAAAQRCVAAWKFTPAEKDGKPMDFPALAVISPSP